MKSPATPATTPSASRASSSSRRESPWQFGSEIPCLSGDRTGSHARASSLSQAAPRSGVGSGERSGLNDGLCVAGSVDVHDLDRHLYSEARTSVKLLAQGLQQPLRQILLGREAAAGQYG